MSAAYLQRGDGSRASTSLFESLGLQSTVKPRSNSGLMGPARACPMSQRLSSAAASAPTTSATMLWLEGASDQGLPVEDRPASTSLFAALGLEKGSVPSARGTPRSLRRAARQMASPKKVHSGLLDGGKLNSMRSVGSDSTLTTMPTVPEFSDESSDDYGEHFFGSSNL